MPLHSMLLYTDPPSSTQLAPTLHPLHIFPSTYYMNLETDIAPPSYKYIENYESCERVEEHHAHQVGPTGPGQKPRRAPWAKKVTAPLRKRQKLATEPVPLPPPPQGWTCPSCSQPNSARASQCSRCFMPMSAVSDIDFLWVLDNGHIACQLSDCLVNDHPPMKDGDWTCRGCGAANQGSPNVNAECYMCGQPRDRRGKPPRNLANAPRFGDWICVKDQCRAINSRSWKECAECTEPRNAASGRFAFESHPVDFDSLFRQNWDGKATNPDADAGRTHLVFCKQHLNGVCGNGDRCALSHDLKRFPCQYDLNMSCLAGDRCPFSHSLLPASKTPTERQQAYDEFLRNMEATGALKDPPVPMYTVKGTDTTGTRACVKFTPRKPKGKNSDAAHERDVPAPDIDPPPPAEVLSLKKQNHQFLKDRYGSVEPRYQVPNSRLVTPKEEKHGHKWARETVAVVFACASQQFDLAKFKKELTQVSSDIKFPIAGADVVAMEDIPGSADFPGGFKLILELQLLKPIPRPYVSNREAMHQGLTAALGKAWPLRGGVARSESHPNLMPWQTRSKIPRSTKVASAAYTEEEVKTVFDEWVRAVASPAVKGLTSPYVYPPYFYDAAAEVPPTTNFHRHHALAQMRVWLDMSRDDAGLFGIQVLLTGLCSCFSDVTSVLGKATKVFVVAMHRLLWKAAGHVARSGYQMPEDWDAETVLKVADILSAKTSVPGREFTVAAVRQTPVTAQLMQLGMCWRQLLGRIEGKPRARFEPSTELYAAQPQAVLSDLERYLNEQKLDLTQPEHVLRAVQNVTDVYEAFFGTPCDWHQHNPHLTQSHWVVLAPCARGTGAEDVLRVLEGFAVETGPFFSRFAPPALHFNPADGACCYVMMRSAQEASRAVEELGRRAGTMVVPFLHVKACAGLPAAYLHELMHTLCPSMEALAAAENAATDCDPRVALLRVFMNAVGEAYMAKPSRLRQAALARCVLRMPATHLSKSQLRMNYMIGAELYKACRAQWALDTATEGEWTDEALPVFSQPPTFLVGEPQGSEGKTLAAWP